MKKTNKNKLSDGLNLCIFCGSKNGSDPDFEKYARNLGVIMAKQSINLIYGGGNTGLMGTISKAIVENGGYAKGIIPNFLEIDNDKPRYSDITIVSDMYERKKMMLAISDAFCVLPGGLGTIDEFFEILAFRQLGLHKKPLILANWKGYWDGLIKNMVYTEEKQFNYISINRLFKITEGISDILHIVRKELQNPD